MTNWENMPVPPHPGSALLEFESRLEKWLAACQTLVNEHHAKRTWSLNTKLELMRGTRYIRVVAVDGDRRSSWAFIDKTNGDVLKSETWAKPAKHARGNLFDESGGMSQIEWHGPRYLK